MTGCPENEDMAHSPVRTVCHSSIPRAVDSINLLLLVASLELVVASLSFTELVTALLSPSLLMGFDTIVINPVVSDFCSSN